MKVGRSKRKEQKQKGGQSPSRITAPGFSSLARVRGQLILVFRRRRTRGPRVYIWARPGCAVRKQSLSEVPSTEQAHFGGFPSAFQSARTSSHRCVVADPCLVSSVAACASRTLRKCLPRPSSSRWTSSVAPARLSSRLFIDARTPQRTRTWVSVAVSLRQWW